MKFILDANLSWRLIKMIQDDFTHVIHAKSIPIKQPAVDYEIWEYAKNNDYHIITLDNDFSKMSLLYNTIPKIIQLRLRNETNAFIAFKLITNKTNIFDFLNNPTQFVYEIFY